MEIRRASKSIAERLYQNRPLNDLLNSSFTIRALQEGEKQAELLLCTAECYYEENGSATRASERLHLHKNSLLYRMKRLYQLLGIEKDTAFVREFYVRLLLEYWNQNF